MIVVYQTEYDFVISYIREFKDRLNKFLHNRDPYHKHQVVSTSRMETNIKKSEIEHKSSNLANEFVKFFEKEFKREKRSLVPEQNLIDSGYFCGDHGLLFNIAMIKLEKELKELLEFIT